MTLPLRCRRRKKLVETCRFNELLLVAETGLEPATSGLCEIQSLCVTVPFCWVWWYCVPRLRTDFVPCVQRGCYTVLTRPNPFWGQFWGQNGKADSHTHRSNKCAALVSLRNTNTNITRFSHRKSPTNQYISFTLQQEVVCKPYSTTSSHTAPVATRNVPVWARSQRVGAVLVRPYTAPKFPLSGDFFILPQRHLPERDFPVQGNPAQINN